MSGQTDAILALCRKLPPTCTAIVHPVKANVIAAGFEAMREGLIAPVLIGPAARIAEAAREAGVDIAGWEIVNTEHSHAAAAKAAELAAGGNVSAIMKGSLHTDELLGEIVPDIEAGNMLAKQLTFLGGAEAAGIVLGARVPIVLTSRADDQRTRLLSSALACLLADARAKGRIK